MTNSLIRSFKEKAIAKLDSIPVVSKLLTVAGIQKTVTRSINLNRILGIPLDQKAPVILEFNASFPIVFKTTENLGIISGKSVQVQSLNGVVTLNPLDEDGLPMSFNELDEHTLKMIEEANKPLTPALEGECSCCSTDPDNHNFVAAVKALNLRVEELEAKLVGDK